jgi:hypothetical protein
MGETMTTELDQRPMTRRNDAPVKIDVQVLADARIAAAYKGLSLAEYLSEALRPIVLRDMEEGHAQRVRQPKPKSGK